MYVIRRTANRNGMACVGFLKKAARLGCAYAPLGEAKKFKTIQDAEKAIEKYCAKGMNTYEILEVR